MTRKGSAIGERERRLLDKAARSLCCVCRLHRVSFFFVAAFFTQQRRRLAASHGLVLAVSEWRAWADKCSGQRTLIHWPNAVFTHAHGTPVLD